MIKEENILKNRMNTFNKNVASFYTQRAENSKLSIRKDQLESYIDAKRLKLHETINMNDINTLTPEKILNFQELNLKKELSLSEILEKLKFLLKNFQNWYEETSILKECVIGIRKITCRQLTRESDKIFQNEIHILLLKILEYYQSFEEYNEDEEIIIHESLWSITNLSCLPASEIFKQIKLRNSLLVLRNYLYSKVDRLLDQTALCLGNIIVETNEFRDMAINLGILDKAVNISKDVTMPVELIKNCMFLISNILRGRPKPQLEKIAPSLAIISACLWNKDEDIVKSCLWSISYISDGYENIQNTIISTGCLTKVLEYAMFTKKDYQLPSLRIIGNLAAGPKKIVERLLNENVVKVIADLLEIVQEKFVMIELLWIVKNFSDSTVDVINYMISYPNFCSALIKLCANNLNYDNKIDVINIFYNFVKNGNKCTMKILIESELVEYICSELDFIKEGNSDRNKFLMLCLGVLNKMLSSSKRENDNEGVMETGNKMLSVINKYSIIEKLEQKINNYDNKTKSLCNQKNTINELIRMAINTIKILENSSNNNDLNSELQEEQIK